MDPNNQNNNPYANGGLPPASGGPVPPTGQPTAGQPNLVSPVNPGTPSDSGMPNPYQEAAAPQVPAAPPMVVVPGQWIPQQPIPPADQAASNPYMPQPAAPASTALPGSPSAPTQPLEANPYMPQSQTPADPAPAQSPPPTGSVLQQLLAEPTPSAAPAAEPAPASASASLPFIEPAVPNPTYSSKSGLPIGKLLLIILPVIGLLLLGLWFVPQIRLAIVNALGMGATMKISTVTVVGQADSKQQPLNNVTLKINDVSVNTGGKAVTTVKGIPYGAVEITATKDGYDDATFRANLTFDPLFGLAGGGETVNPTITMLANGPPVTFKAVDWLSGQPITSGQFTIGDVTVTPDSQGLVRARLAKADQTTVAVQSKFGGAYIDKKFNYTIPDQSTTNQTTPAVTFVPAGKHYYFGAKDNPYTLFSSNVDGSDQQEVIQATGKETPDVNFMVSPNGDYGMLASSRDGARDSEQELLQRVYVVNLKTKKLTKVDEANAITFADWSNNNFVYVLTNYKAGKRDQTLRSADAASGRVYNFETAGGLDSLAIAYDKVVYLRTDTQAPQSEQSPQLKVATVQGNDLKTLGTKVDPNSILQLAYGKLAFKSADQAWQEYDMQSAQQKTATQPEASLNIKTRYIAVPSPDNSRRLYLKGSGFNFSMFVEDSTNGQSKELLPTSTFTGSVRWLNSSVVIFSLFSGNASHSYAISLDANTPKKIGKDAPSAPAAAPSTAGTATITPR